MGGWVGESLYGWVGGWMGGWNFCFVPLVLVALPPVHPPYALLLVMMFLVDLALNQSLVSEWVGGCRTCSMVGWMGGWNFCFVPLVALLLVVRRCLVLVELL